MKRDKLGKFKFASLQSKIGIGLTKKFNINTNIFDSVVLIKNDKVFIKSSAVLEILKDMPIGWKLFRIGFILPKFVRDWMYDVIGKYRYKIFGKKDECPIPSKDVQDKFLG